jgi:threonylcarbamoyladenosine tRNA methylthiotransferase MtaB
LKASVAFKSFGCRTNQHEIFSLSGRMARDGHPAADASEADIVVINTCCVTAYTETKARRYMQALRRANPGVKMLVTGCLAQRSPRLMKQMAGVEWVVGNAFKDEVPRIIESGADGVYHGPLAAAGPGLHLDDGLPDGPAAFNRTRYSMKIQEGCDFSCAYCIVPHVRGMSRSAESDRLLAQFRRAVEGGCREIVLSGTHIGQFRDSRGTGLEGLLGRLLAVEGDFRIRLSSLDPRDLTDEITGLVCTHEKICRHLHVSVQSLDETVLGAMNRPSVPLDRLAGRLSGLRRACPHLGLGGDFIVGFPGETERMFARTLERVREIGFSYGHVFRYSPRPSTAAAAMRPQVPESEKSARSRILRETLRELHGAFVGGMAGTACRVLVETEIPPRGLLSNYVRARLVSGRASRNSWINGTITGYDHTTLEAIAEPAQGNGHR